MVRAMTFVEQWRGNAPLGAVAPGNALACRTRKPLSFVDSVHISYVLAIARSV